MNKYRLTIEQVVERQIKSTKEYLESYHENSWCSVLRVQLYNDEDVENLRKFLKKNRTASHIELQQNFLKQQYFWQLSEMIRKDNFNIDRIEVKIINGKLSSKVKFKLQMLLYRNTQIKRQKMLLLMMKNRAMKQQKREKEQQEKTLEQEKEEEKQEEKQEEKEQEEEKREKEQEEEEKKNLFRNVPKYLLLYIMSFLEQQQESESQEEKSEEEKSKEEQEKHCERRRKVTLQQLIDSKCIIEIPENNLLNCY